MRTVFRGRLARLEEDAGLSAGSIESVPRSILLDALVEVIAGQATRRANVLLRARKTGKNSDLQALARAIRAGAPEAFRDSLERVLQMMSDEQLERVITLARERLGMEEGDADYVEATA